MRIDVRMKLMLWMPLLVACTGQPSQNENVDYNYGIESVNTDSVTVFESYSATVKGQQDVEIYPQVSGIITRLCVNEGDIVKKGDVMFVIDQVPYRAALRIAVASRQAAEAQVKSAELDYKSKQTLYREEVVSDYDLALSENTLGATRAQLEQTKAAEINAENDLSYTVVKSPVNGVVGTLPYRAGALVGPDIPVPLTTVSDNSRMYVYFSMSENQLRDLINQYGSPSEIIRNMPDIRLRLNDGSLYTHSGRVESISGILNAQTGTVSIRGIFPNEKRLLFSGSAASVIIPHTIKKAVIIPQSATFEIQDKVFVYKVANGVGTAAEIKVKSIDDGKDYIVSSGLSAGERIITKGVATFVEGTPISESK